MRIILFGSTGMLGEKINYAALEAGIKIVKPNKTSVDFMNPRSIYNFFTKIHKDDFIINAAAYTDVELSEVKYQKALQTNSTSVEVIANLCEKVGAFFIHISTDYVFNGKLKRPYNEEDIPRPLNAYGTTKLIGERKIQNICKRYIIIRTSWLFAHNKKCFPNTIISKILNNEKIKVISDQFGGPTSASALANLLIEVVKYNKKNQFSQQELCGVFHFCQKPYLSWFEFAQTIANLLEQSNLAPKNYEITPCSSNVYRSKAKRPKNSRLDSSKIEKYNFLQNKSWMDDLKNLILKYDKEK